jgi:hypothetical protein
MSAPNDELAGKYVGAFGDEALWYVTGIVVAGG